MLVTLVLCLAWCVQVNPCVCDLPFLFETQLHAMAMVVLSYPSLAQPHPCQVVSWFAVLVLQMLQLTLVLLHVVQAHVRLQLQWTLLLATMLAQQMLVSLALVLPADADVVVVASVMWH